jgi:hypothetical protein
VQYARTLGARPSSARPYKERLAQYVYEFPAEKIEVTRRALIKCGKPVTPRFRHATVYGDANRI